MNDLISRQAAMELLYKRLIESANNNVGYVTDAGIVFEDIATERIKRWLNELPTIDAVPVKHGKWTAVFVEYTDGTTGARAECPFCKEQQLTWTNFCPNCGAKMKMRGENED